MGAPPEVLAQARATAAGKVALAILPCNLDAARVFWAMGTQWRVAAGMSGALRLGLDYGALPGVMRFLGIPRRRWGDVFEQLQVIELAALKAAR